MEGNKNIIAVVFALILVGIYWVATLYVLNPVLRAEGTTLEHEIAFYIDTLSTVESGKVRMEIPENIVRGVRVEKLDKGEYDDYEVPDTGWYVTVTYRMSGVTSKSISPVRSYPPDADISSQLYSSGALCIVKESDLMYAVVDRC